MELKIKDKVNLEDLKKFGLKFYNDNAIGECIGGFESTGK